MATAERMKAAFHDTDLDISRASIEDNIRELYYTLLPKLDDIFHNI